MRLIAGFYTSCRCHKLLITLSYPSLSVRLRPRGWTQLTCPAAAWRSCLLSSFTAMTSHTSISKTTSFPCTKVFQHLPGEFMSLLHSLHSDWIYCTLCVREHSYRRSQQMKSSILLFVFFLFWMWNVPQWLLLSLELPYALERKQLGSNYRWRLSGRLWSLDD